MNFWNLLTGNDQPTVFAGLIFFALIGTLLSLLMQTTKRDINAQSTPFRFSWSFLWCDNTKRIAAGVILIYVCLRFTPEIFGVSITNFYALIIGFSSDKLAQFVKNKTNILGGNRS